MGDPMQIHHGMHYTNLNQFGIPGFTKITRQSICTLPFYLTKCYKPMLLYLISPCLALTQGHGAPGERGRDGEEEGRITGRAEQRWMKGGNGVTPYLLVTV